jgi:flagellar hook-associated protein 2
MSTISSGLSSVGSSSSSSSSPVVAVQGLGAISSTSGLISGLPIQTIVNELLSEEAAPRNQLTTQNQTIQTQQTAYTQLEAYLLGLEATTNGLTSKSLYTSQSLTSSNSAALTAAASATGNPATGTYTYTPIRQVQAQQYTSSKFSSTTAPIGAGSITIRNGGFVDNGVSLDLLNGGQGFTPGQIQITDRSGATSTIDLSQARSVDDVINDINNDSAIDVTATAVGDSFQLTDDTGQTTSNLKVQEVNGGSTAASLGLAGVNVAATQAQGSQVLSLFGALPLSQINQGVGVQFDNAMPDLQVNFGDGTSTTVDFNKIPTVGTFPQGTTNAANGKNAAVQFTAVSAGSAYAGVSVVFQDSNTVTEGNETTSYDSTNKILTFNIDAGHTTANDIVAALQKNSTVSGLFTASTVSGGTGTGLISDADTAITAGPPSTGTTSALTTNAKIQFTAVQGGPAYDGVAVSFVDNPAIVAGRETVAYNATSKQLVFQIAAGSTTANDVIKALNNDPTASQVFTAAAATGSSGTGIVSASDTATTSGGAIIEPVPAGDETTLEDVLNTLNAAAPGKLQASISSDGQAIQLTDLTGGTSSTFSVSDLNGSHAAEDLGLSVAASGSTIAGAPLIGGLKTSLLRDLNGGQGLGQLGSLEITDRIGNPASIDLSQAKTLDDVIGDINNAGVGVTASINQARDGIQIVDTTGGSGNLIVANGDATETADKLKITASAAASTDAGGDLNLQVVSENTSLASLNGGQGVEQGYFSITDSNGATARVQIGKNQTTLSDVITAINSLGLGVNASLNSTGDGLLLTDTAHGSGTLKVTEGAGTTAANLHLLSAATTSTIAGQPTQTIDGSTATTITTSATDTITDLINKINAAGAGVTASLFSDGSSVAPYSLQLTSTVAGQAGSVQIDSSGLGISLQQTVAGADALLLVDTPGSAGTLVSSPSNTFSNVLAGGTLTVSGVSTTPVSITASSDITQLQATIQTLVTEYNQVQSNIGTLTAYNSTTNTSGTLQGDPRVLQIQQEMANLLTSQTSGFGSVQSLADLGVTIGQDGTASFDSSVLQSKFAADPQDVQNFLSTTTTGVSAQFQTVIEQLAGPDDSVLSSANDALTVQSQDNTAKISQYNAVLSSEQTRLLSAFYAQESVLAQLQSNQQIVAQLQDLTPLGQSSSSSTSSSSSG